LGIFKKKVKKKFKKIICKGKKKKQKKKSKIQKKKNLQKCTLTVKEGHRSMKLQKPSIFVVN